LYSSGITEVEMRAVKESCERVNGKEVYLIHEPMAAAIGIGIDIMQPKGNMIVDIGGATEIAVIALGGIVCDKSVRLQVTFSRMISYITCVPNTIYLWEKVQLKDKNPDWSGN
jgi:rod shape-determining protein MreB